MVEGDAGHRVAFWATILIAVSPMFILTNAIALSHTTTLTCLILAGLGFQRACGQQPVAGALLCGTALGFGLTVRPQVVVPMGMVIGLTTLYQLLRRRNWAAVGALVASGSVWLILIALYNRALSGSPSKLPWYLFLPIERFGFGHVGGVDFEYTPWGAVENLVVSAVRLNGWWLGWPLSLGLLPASILGAHAIVRGLERWPRAVSAILLVHFAVGTTSFLWENVRRLDRLVMTTGGVVVETGFSWRQCYRVSMARIVALCPRPRAA